MSTTATQLQNLPTAARTDEYGALIAELRLLEARRDALKAALIERAGTDTELAGDAFRVRITHSTRTTMDAAPARAVLGEAWAIKHSKVTQVATLRPVPLFNASASGTTP